MRFHTKAHWCRRYYGERPTFIAVLHVFRDSERDAGGGEGSVGQKWKFQRDAIIERQLICFTYARFKASLQLLSVVQKKRHSDFLATNTLH